MHLRDRGDGEPVNIGQETEIKLTELAQMIASLVGSPSTVSIINDFPEGYNYQLIPDIRRAKDVFGWFPITLLRDGLEHTIDDLKASQDLIEVKGIEPSK